jgi:soluble lytic murein transglycosylase
MKLGRYNEAEQILRSIQNQRISDFHKTRSQFWLAKMYQLQGKDNTASQIYLTIGQDLFSSYYNLKSYMMYEQEIDSLLDIRNRLADDKNPLRYYTTSIAPLMEKFKVLFLLREILGEDIALQELSEKKYYPETLKGWISLAEIYKKLGAYNRAFRIYDYINNKHFADLTDLEKPFLLKESYPLYYDNIVGKYEPSREIDKNLVFALIRAESSFNTRAHSWANAYGLMQIVPRTGRTLARELGEDYDIPEDLYEPEVNINLGTYYLRQLLDKFDNQKELAIAAYNAGPHRVVRWKKFLLSEDTDFFIENIEYTQTRTYVRRVMKNYWIYLLLDQIN